MVCQFLNVLTNSDDLSIEIALESSKRFDSVPGIPNWGRRHAKHLRPLFGGPLEIFPHYTVVSMILPRMMTFVKNHERNLSE